MIIVIRKKILVAILLFAIVVLSIIFFIGTRDIKSVFNSEDYNTIISDNIMLRNNSILSKNQEDIKKLYDLDKKYGVWAYEHEINKMKYLHKWSEKQGIKFISIKSNPIINWVKEYEEKTTLNLTVSTEYKYVYKDDVESISTFRIGTYHLIDIQNQNDEWIIIKDWYDDPFADILSLKEEYMDNIKKIILEGKKDNIELSERRKKAIEYADKYIGAADDGSNDYKYNKDYKNYNSLGGDCANFASQALHEGGKFEKNYSWNYIKDGTRAWVNAQGFKDYMIYSGRGSLIAHGDYNKVLQSSYQLLPGDFIAYEKKGKVVHISMVTGIDSKGYRLVNCHNTDRYRVPWDLGFSASKIKYWFVRVNY
ncbi:amidase domain-containing protein [Clostridium sp. D2Q-11]|uniref:Amidase domain-containing protein n=1 Tax=Anaeromonas frigoriresistens TaxID=2683708 RepID=A0A942UQA1_9FIRM|nr:amidase domain-containing protein [Anaeromonas frigoriresistens]MBS4537314.1 amidase domain-containing protein [Anaeromonas frigoriresistens]